jgi:hypothetical protein
MELAAEVPNVEIDEVASRHRFDKVEEAFGELNGGGAMRLV